MRIRQRYYEKEEIREDNYSESDETVITVPDQALSVAELYDRSLEGYTWERQSIEDDIESELDDIDLEEFQRLDILEQQEIVAENKLKIADMEKSIKEAKAKEKAEAKEEAKKETSETKAVTSQEEQTNSEADSSDEKKEQ